MISMHNHLLISVITASFGSHLVTIEGGKMNMIIRVGYFFLYFAPHAF